MYPHILNVGTTRKMGGGIIKRTKRERKKYEEKR
jgi:hypothetical protein